MKKNVIFLAFIVMGLCGLGTVHAQEKTQMKLRLNQGDEYMIKQTMEQEMTQQLMGEKMEMSQNSVMESSIKVISVDQEGNMTLKTVLDSVKTKIESLGNVIEYDSKNPPENPDPMLEGFEGLVGKEYTMVISPKGKVLELKGLEDALSGMFDENNPDQAASDAGTDQFNEMFGDEGMKQIMENIYSPFPAEPVGVGDKWETTAKLPNPMMALVMNNVATLTDRSNGLVTIEMDSTISTDEEGSSKAFGAMNMSSKITSGQQHAVSQFDENSGWLVRSDVTQEISMEMKLDMPADQAPEDMPEEYQNMSIPMTMKSKATIESHKLNK